MGESVVERISDGCVSSPVILPCDSTAAQSEIQFSFPGFIQKT